jgi:thiosulfate dehydrogenase [quinone] large subunit
MTTAAQSTIRVSSLQTGALVTLRMLVGWHFLYEGLAKLANPYWTSAGYLDASQWWFSGIFRNLAASPTAVTIIDYVNMWGLTAIGLGLLLGLLTRWATVAGIVVLLLYYIAAPPFVGLSYAMPTEGSYLVVNKILIEAGAMFVLLVFPTGHVFGLDRLIPWRRSTAQAAAVGA